MGAETRIAVAEDIVLDFAGLFSPIEGEKQAPESPTEPFLRAGEYKTITEPQKPAERLTEGLEGQQAKKLYLDTQREREDRQRSLEVYRTYQENIKTSSQLQTEILKGLKAGEDVYSLFLKAAKAISLMTSNSLFYSQIEEDIEAIYGRGLQHKPPAPERATGNPDTATAAFRSWAKGTTPRQPGTHTESHRSPQSNNRTA